MRARTLPIAALVLALPALAEEPKPRRAAVLIACQAYQDNTTFPSVDHARNDITDFKAVLLRTGYPADGVTVLADGGPAGSGPTRKRIVEQLSALGDAKRFGPADTVVVAFVGRGFQPRDGGPHLVPLDGRGGDASTLIPLAEVIDRLRQCKAGNKLVLLDADGIGRADPGLKPDAGNLTVLVSCAEGQRSHADPRAGRGFFLSEVVRGWDGAATPDPELTVGTLCDFVIRETATRAEAAGRKQQPVASKAGADWPVWRFGQVGCLVPVATHRDLAAACSPDGRTALTGNRHGELTLWDVPTGQDYFALEQRPWADDSTLQALGSGAADLRLFRLYGHAAPIGPIEFFPDGRHVATGSIDGMVRLWRLDEKGMREDGGPFRAVDGTRTFEVARLAVSPDGSRLAAADTSGAVRVWDVTERKLVGKVEPDRTDEGLHEVRHLTFRPDGKAFFLGTTARLRVYAVAPSVRPDPRQRVDPKGLPGFFVSAFAPDNRIVLLGGAGGRLHRWEPQSGQFDPLPVADRPCAVLAIACPADGRAVSAHADGTVRLWDLRDERQPFRRLVRSNLRFVADRASFSVDGRTALFVDAKGHVGVWSVPER